MGGVASSVNRRATAARVRSDADRRTGSAGTAAPSDTPVVGSRTRVGADAPRASRLRSPASRVGARGRGRRSRCSSPASRSISRSSSRTRSRRSCDGSRTCGPRRSSTSRRSSTACATRSSIWIIRVVVLVIAALFKRWRHLVTILALYVVVDFLDTILAVQRPEPEGVTVLSSNATTVFPSLPVAALSVTLFGAVMVLASVRPASQARPGGRLRGHGARRARPVAPGRGLPARCRVFAPARLDHRRVRVRVLRPRGRLPRLVRAGREVRAPGPRRRAGRGDRRGGPRPARLHGDRDRAVRARRLGGSSPLRMRVAEIDGHLFGKIYSTSHLRADRWYKVGRSILYGQLEDEVPLGSVRRLALYEDYALRLLRDVGIGVATTYGIVELTPDREYMLVTEFFSNATTLGDAEVDDAIIDEGMELVQRLWASGLAHRDLKPANMLVRGGHLQLVDVSGLQVRPTPWRQAVDLANMMLTLALSSDPDRVYERAIVGLLSGRRRRGVRGRPRARHPDPGDREAEGGRPADPRTLPRARARSSARLDPGVERPTRRAHGRRDHRCRSRSPRWCGRRSRSAWTDGTGGRAAHARRRTRVHCTDHRRGESRCT